MPQNLLQPPRAARVRSRLRLLQRTCEPAPPSTDARSCRSGGHATWWEVEAESDGEALALLPRDVAEHTTVSRVTEVEIP